MDVVRVVARAAVRRRWRAHLGVVLLVGLTIGVALVAAAGARRTSSAYERFLSAADVSTITVSSPGAYDAESNDAIAALPEVVRSSTIVGVEVRVLDEDGVADQTQDFEGSTSFDGRYVDQDRMTIVEGRATDPDRPDEVVVNRRATERLGYRVGQQLELGVYSLDAQASATAFEDPVPADHRRPVTVVGVAVLPEEVLQDDFDVLPRLLLTPAFAEGAPDTMTYGIQGLVLRRGDADIDALRRGLADIDPAGLSVFQRTSADAYHAEQALRPLAVALGLFALIAFGAGLVLAAQAVARAVRADDATGAALRAFGAGPGTVVAATAAAPLAAGAVGVVVAATVAVLASPTMPIGPMREVEPDPGFHADWTVLVGAGLVTVLVLAVTALRAAQASTAPARSPRLGAVETIIEATDVGPAVATGVREALGARGVIAGASVAVGALVGAITFGTSLDNLVDKPSLYGWNADLAVLAGLGYGNFDAVGATAELDEAGIAEWSGGYFGSSQLDGHEVELLAMDPGAAVPPPLLRGRSIADDDEVVLGSRTADELGRGIGDTVTFLGADGPVDLRVVGMATLPTIGPLHAAHPSLGVGAIVPRAVLPGLDRDITGALVTEDLGPNVLFVRLPTASDPAPTAAALAEALRLSAGFAGIDVLPVQRPAEIVNADSLGAAPVALSVALAAGALASLGVAVGASVRRRRHELAVLKAIGFTRRQLGASVAWHATVTALVGLLIGIPAGIVFGRSLWGRFAAQLDVVSEVTVPVVAVGGLAVVMLLVANLVAWAPARTAARVAVASDLQPMSTV